MGVYVLIYSVLGPLYFGKKVTVTSFHFSAYSALLVIFLSHSNQCNFCF